MESTIDHESCNWRYVASMKHIDIDQGLMRTFFLHDNSGFVTRLYKQNGQFLTYTRLGDNKRMCSVITYWFRNQTHINWYWTSYICIWYRATMVCMEEQVHSIHCMDRGCQGRRLLLLLLTTLIWTSVRGAEAPRATRPARATVFSIHTTCSSIQLPFTPHTMARLSPLLHQLHFNQVSSSSSIRFF